MSGYSDGTVVAALLIAGVFWFIFAVAFYVVGSIFLMKIFEKAGVEGKWRAWIPVYNTLIFAKLGDLSPWWLLILWGGGIVLNWIPFIGFLGSLCFLAAGVYMVLAAWRVGLKLQKEAVWIILYVFLSIVWLGINAFDKSRWNTAVVAAPWANSFLADKTVWPGIPVQPAGYAAAPPAPGAYPPPPAGAYPPPPAPGAYPPPAASTPPVPPTTQPPAPPVQPPAPPVPPTTEPPAPPSDPEAPRV